MSSNLNSRIVDLIVPGVRRFSATRPHALASVRRREVVLALAGLPFAALANPDPLAGLQRWGNGEFRRFGFLVYEATLWAADDPVRPPLALRLDYKRTIAGSAIAEASVKEMRKFGSDEASLQRWGESMVKLFPNVRPGDHIVGIYRTEGAVFLFNGQAIGEIADPAFARQFFAIWLDPRTSAPELRAALLKRPGG
ncbi:MAG: chalcone isomerase family protein [Betaproteobacteria bacterium]|nr:chalcone isomerase family protein [Betaproteobacteria bacterium]